MMGPVSTTYRVYCDECDVKNVVDSKLLAKDLIEAHEEDRNCSAAEWEVV